MPYKNMVNGNDILESIPDAVFTIDSGWRITSFNHAAETLTGIGRDDAMRLPCRDIMKSSACNGDCPLRRTMETGVPVTGFPVSFLRRDGARIQADISASVLRDAGGMVIGGIETIRPRPVKQKSRRGQKESGSALSLREIETLAIVDALRRNRGNKTAAARELMIERSTLYRKIRDYSITEIG